MTRQYIVKARNAENLIFSSLNFYVREGSYLLGFGGFFPFLFALRVPQRLCCISHVLVQQPLSTFPFRAAGEEQAWLCRRPFAGSGVLSTAWPHSGAANGPGSLDTKAAVSSTEINSVLLPHMLNAVRNISPMLCPLAT